MLCCHAVHLLPLFLPSLPRINSPLYPLDQSGGEGRRKHKSFRRPSLSKATALTDFSRHLHRVSHPELGLPKVNYTTTMASSKPKKGFSMSLGKPKIASSSSGAASKGGDRVSNGGNSKQASAIGVSHDDDDNDGGGKRDYVTGIGGGKVVTKEVVVERGPRVISLVSNPWAKGSNSSSSSNGTTPAAAVPPHDPSTAPPADEQPPAAVAEKSLDQLAAEAIAQESLRGDARGDGGAANGYGLGLDSDRVIGMLGGGTGAETTQAGSAPPQAASTDGGSSSKKRTGLLEQNMIPGIMDVDGEDAKFKHDLGHRAEDLSARSKAYVDVPVAEFGAALLRGMGWTGPDGDGGAGAAGSPLPTDIEPRHHRLGLGAQPKPPEEVRSTVWRVERKRLGCVLGW